MNQRLGRVVYVVMLPVLRFALSDKTRARVLVINGDKVLLLRNWIGTQQWTLPGGGIQKNEKPKQAIRRELKEELNLKVQKKKFRFLTRTSQNDAKASYPVILYKLEVNSLENYKVRRPEVIEANWFDISDLPKSRRKIIDYALDVSEMK